MLLVNVFIIKLIVWRKMGILPFDFVRSIIQKNKKWNPYPYMIVWNPYSYMNVCITIYILMYEKS